jgi:hypothetical protein
MPPGQGLDAIGVAEGQHDVLPGLDVDPLDLPGAGHDAQLGLGQQVLGGPG